MTKRIELAVVATSHGLGPYHPAFRNTFNGSIHYWPNITMPDEQQACDWASRALNDAEQAAEAIAQQWNVYKV